MVAGLLARSGPRRGLGPGLSCRPPQAGGNYRCLSPGRIPGSGDHYRYGAGVTIPRLNVLVLYAEEGRVFTASTLVQIAGRAGRSAAYPTGRVWFIGRHLSPAIAEAARQIREFNRLARRRGYLTR